VVTCSLEITVPSLYIAMLSANKCNEMKLCTVHTRVHCSSTTTCSLRLWLTAHNYRVIKVGLFDEHACTSLLLYSETLLVGQRLYTNRTRLALQPLSDLWRCCQFYGKYALKVTPSHCT